MAFQERFKGKTNFIKKDGIVGIIKNTSSTFAPPDLLDQFENEFIDRSLVMSQQSRVSRPPTTTSLFSAKQTISYREPIYQYSSIQQQSVSEPVSKEYNSKPYDSKNSGIWRSHSHALQDELIYKGKSRLGISRNKVIEPDPALVAAGQTLVKPIFRLNIDEMADRHQSILRLFDKYTRRK